MFFVLSVIQLITHDDKRKAHFLLPTWVKEPINQYYAETSKSRAERRKDNWYFIIGIVIVLLIGLLAVAFTLTDEAGELIF